jgi:hypothetical protein
VAVQVRRTAGVEPTVLRRSLASTVSRVRRRLDSQHVPAHPLGPDAVTGVLAELAHLDGTTGLTERWSTVQSGLRQACLHLYESPDARSAAGAGSPTILARLLTEPGCAVTVSLAAARLPAGGEVGLELVVRLAAGSEQGLTAAGGALNRLLAPAGTSTERLDGHQLTGLAATLPFGGALDPNAEMLASFVLTDRPARTRWAAADMLQLPAGGAGLMLGVNRYAEPVVIALFRPEPTQVVLVGGLPAAETVAVRTLALGAQVIVQSGRSEAWEPFQRGVGGRTEGFVLVPPGRQVDLPPATPLRPQLVVLDAVSTDPVAPSPWRATLLVRDRLTDPDVDTLASADVVLLQPLSKAEAAVAGAALGVSGSIEWLTRIRADMLAVVAARRTVRWALVSTTPIEQQLIGPITR